MFRLAQEIDAPAVFMRRVVSRRARQSRLAVWQQNPGFPVPWLRAFKHGWYLLPLLSSIFFPQTSQAVPMFTWQEPFQVGQFLRANQGTVTGAFANFGQMASMDQETTNLGAAGEMGPATAFMRAGASVASNPTLFSDAGVGVSFSRAFVLAGSPAGWSVSITGYIAGILSTTLIGSDSSSSVTADADIVRLRGEIAFNAQANSSGFTENTTGAGSVILDDGAYIFEGSLRAFASIGSSDCGFCVSLSNFYNGLAGFSATLDAAPLELVSAPISADSSTVSGPYTPVVDVSLTFPIPEPGTLALICPAIVGLLCWQRQRKERDWTRATNRGSAVSAVSAA
jgi:hypothetical protein